MKIVLFPGVGFHEDTTTHQKFMDSIKKELGCEVGIFVWEHYWTMPENDLPAKLVRGLVSEIILDFQQVIRHSETMEVPDADYYIGHSAGSIIAMSQDKPCIIMGSPAALVECVNDGGVRTTDYSSKKALNIVDKYDVIAHPLNHADVDNFIVKRSWFRLSSYTPYFSHTSYWKNKRVINKIVETIKKWESE